MSALSAILFPSGKVPFGGGALMPERDAGISSLAGRGDTSPCPFEPERLRKKKVSVEGGKDGLF
jgi:hypothetical protein